MKRWIPTREQLRASRWLRPVAHHIDNEHLWRTDRHSVARAVAIGLFFGLMIPVAQFLFAIVTAAALRAHIAIAAAATLISNPLTFPPIYWAAFKLGGFLLGTRNTDDAAQRIEAETADLFAKQGFIEGIWGPIQSAGAPLLLGLAVMAVSAAVSGYGLVWALWRPRVNDGEDKDAGPTAGQ